MGCGCGAVGCGLSAQNADLSVISLSPSLPPSLSPFRPLSLPPSFPISLSPSPLPSITPAQCTSESEAALVLQEASRLKVVALLQMALFRDTRNA
mmetsp:Transcript_19498/g.43443  ORF Transcript_19498/g.43443 Transcript_19498/m.43443 type:complete len:95 (+) Transcript_19498:868-1152(+)